MSEKLPDDTKMVLNPCPFCGAQIRIHKWSLRRQVYCDKCHIGTEMGKFESKEDAIFAWNRRTPEPGTSVIRWVRYDGTPETLPEEGKPVRLSRGEFEITSLFEGYWVDATDTFAGDPEIGDIWAYLPDPPEGM